MFEKMPLSMPGQRRRLMIEQRSYRRINFQTEAELAIANQTYSCDLVDLALQGALYKSTTNLPITIGEQCQLTINLPNSALTLEFTGELIHQRGHFYGFLFQSKDLETIAHLRRLLALNIGDGDEVDREFLHWLKR